jgi:hypothetical protein
MSGPLATFVAAVRGGAAPVAVPAALERYEFGRLTSALAALLDDLAGQPAVAGPAGRTQA